MSDLIRALWMIYFYIEPNPRHLNIKHLLKVYDIYIYSSGIVFLNSQNWAWKVHRESTCASALHYKTEYALFKGAVTWFCEKHIDVPTVINFATIIFLSGDRLGIILHKETKCFTWLSKIPAKPVITSSTFREKRSILRNKRI